MSLCFPVIPSFLNSFWETMNLTGVRSVFFQGSTPVNDMFKGLKSRGGGMSGVLPRAPGCLGQNSHFVSVGTCCVTSPLDTLSSIYVDLQRTEGAEGESWRFLCTIQAHIYTHTLTTLDKFLQDITPTRLGRRKLPPIRDGAD